MGSASLSGALCQHRASAPWTGRERSPWSSGCCLRAGPAGRVPPTRQSPGQQGQVDAISTLPGQPGLGPDGPPQGS